MVGFAQRGGDGAVGEGAALVAGGEGEALGWGGEPGFAAEVQDFAVGAQECGDELPWRSRTVGPLKMRVYRK